MLNDLLIWYQKIFFYSEQGYLADNMNLYFGGKELAEGVVGDYNIKANSTIQASIPMVGGGIEPTIAAIAK